MTPLSVNQAKRADGVGGRASSLASPPTEVRRRQPSIGAIVAGRYQVLDQLGTGSLGTVYVCADRVTTQRVALKVFRRELASDDEFMRRLRRQAKLAAALSENQPGMLAVYDCDRLDDGSAYIATEYIEGRTLKDVVRQSGPLDVPRALRLGCQIAESLDVIHSAGHVHGDVRAENIFIVSLGEDEQAKLKGFEVAALRDTPPVDCLIRAGVVASNPEYLAPEQVEGDRVTVRTDIYAFGVVLYEMLSGRVPFSSSMPDSVMAKHLQETPIPLGTLRREIPSVLELRVTQALEKEPERRQRYIGDVANADLTELVADEQQAIVARERRGVPGRVANALRSRFAVRRGPATEGVPLGYPWKVGVVAVVVILVSVLAVWMRPSRQKPQEVQVPTLQQRLGTSTPADQSRPGRSDDGGPASSVSTVPAEDLSVTADKGAVAAQVGEDATARKATTGAPAPKDVVGPRTSDSPTEASLLPPGTRGHAQKRPRPANRVEAPVTEAPRAVPDPTTKAPAASAPETPTQTRGIPEPTAIIDWLFGQPPGKD